MRQELDTLTQPIINIFNHIEADLLVEIAKRFDTYDTVGGSLEWQIRKLQELGSLDQNTVKIIAKLSNKTEAEILTMLNEAGFANLDVGTLTKAYNAGAISVNPSVLMESPVMSSIIEQSYKELQGTYRLIQTKALESAKQAYMDVINRTYIEVSSGTYDYQTSIRRGLQRMAAKGITGATYARGGTTVQYSLEGTVRRDTLTAVHQLANRAALESCKVLGADYVEISSHLGARVNLTNPIANHAGWQGKVFKVEGKDKKYGNLKENTGYPGDIQGLGGVNCRHRMFPFFPGISEPNPIKYNEADNRRVYELQQQQRAMERKLRQFKKQRVVALAANDDVSVKKLDAKIKNKTAEINTFCKTNNLKRDVSRENIYT